MNKVTMKKVLFALVILAIATMTACNLAAPAQESSTVEVVMGGLGEGARSFGTEANWVKINVVNSSGVSVGSGDLAKPVDVWRGKINVSQSGTMRFIATAGSVATEVRWSGNDNTYIVGQVVGEIHCTAGAAYLCDNLTLGGYSDWFLPSLDELNTMYNKRVAIDGLSPSWYWSSSEYAGESTIAWTQFLSGGGAQSDSFKNTTCLVRAVRAF